MTPIYASSSHLVLGFFVVKNSSANELIAQNKEIKMKNQGMVKVMTRRGYDYVKAELLNYFVATGYVQALS